MHPNAELARELERCVSTSNADLSHSGLRKQLIVPNGDGFAFTQKGKDFVAKWTKDHKPKAPAPAVVISNPIRQSDAIRPAYSSTPRRDSTPPQGERSYARHSEFRDTRSASAGSEPRRTSESSQARVPETSQRQFGRAPQFQQRRVSDNRSSGSREQFR